MTEVANAKFKVNEVVDYVEFAGGKSYPAVVIKRECNWTYTIKPIGDGAQTLMRTEAGLHKNTGSLDFEISSLRQNFEQAEMMLKAAIAHKTQSN